MSKYDRLRSFLSTLPDGKKWHSATFEELERVLGFPLPPSARRHGGWWTNTLDGTHSQARAWLEAGWRVWRSDLARESVEFERLGAMVPDAMMAETTVPFRHQPRSPEVADPVSFDRAKLSITARRILDDYTAEFDGDVQAALDRALHEARVAFRRRLMDSIVRTGVPSAVSSVDLIREDRDAR